MSLGHKRRLAIKAGVIVLLLAAASPGRAEDFYQGKDVRLLISSGVGGGYDLQSRLLGKYLEKYLPGHPTIVPQNMVGAGGLTEANYMYNVARKDGTVIGMLMSTVVAVQAVGAKGVQFDAAKMNWLGTPEQEIRTIYAWHTSGIKTIEDVMHREATIGASAKGSETYVLPQLANVLLGTKFKIVTGYQGSATINMALERGDLQTADAGTPATLRRFKPDWFKGDKPKITFLIHSGDGGPELAGTPTFLGLAKNDADRRLIGLVLASARIGRPLVAPPGLPAERVAELRTALDAAMKDPDYVK
jgi:tripartite-type tricarboxylate transporter receptor subunit TctC